DYNRAEITFSQNRLVTKDLRIIVEFEYSDQNYLRSIFTGNAEFEQEKGKIYFNFYSEQDAKNSGSIQDLDSLEIATLRLAGDNIDQAFVSGTDTIESFNEFQVAYKQVDTLIPCQGLVGKLVYTVDPDSAKYSASFLDVGFGNGDYILDEGNAANGRVYVFVDPDPGTCVRQGQYLPVKKLIAPNQVQIMALGGEYQISKNLSLRNEISLSRSDLNRFSTLDNADNLGMANRTDLLFEKEIGAKDSTLTFGTQLSYEWVGEDFRFLKPYRDAEFNRNWNLTRNNLGSFSDSTFNAPTQEHLPSANIYLEKKGLGKIGYTSSALIRKDLYDGFQQKLSININRNDFQLSGQGILLNSSSNLENTSYQRPNLKIRKNLGTNRNWTLGFDGLREWNNRRISQADSLELNSFGFNDYQVFVERTKSDSFQIRIGYGQRHDYTPLGNDLFRSSYSDNVDLSGNWLWKSFSRLSWKAQLRKLTITNESLSTFDPKDSFLGRIEHGLRLWSGALSNNLVYELGSGQEPLIEYRYLEVQPGEGVYFWDATTTDYNGDGVPQVDEIQEAVFSDQANIIRVSLITNEFTQTNNVRFNQRLRFEPRHLFKKSNQKNKWLQYLSWQSTIQINRKTREDESVSQINPFLSDIPDSSLVTINLSNQHTLFFRPKGTKFDWRGGRSSRRSRNLLTTGFDERELGRWFTKFRWNLNQTFSLGLEGALKAEKRDMQLFDRQDYEVDSWMLLTDFTYRPLKDLRVILKAGYDEGENGQQLGAESYSNQEYKVEVTYNQSIKTSVRLNFTGALVDFTGEANSPVELVMLDGLKDGKNFLWELALNRSLSQNILLTLNYNGRKTGQNSTVHLGSVQMSARF
ncbi:MAG: hypothetical protein HKN16_05325, partial [Saprospiraceae bacterium]|nr:hypothetical protein [Saprospiraceae bacterium]